MVQLSFNQKNCYEFAQTAAGRATENVSTASSCVSPFRSCSVLRTVTSDARTKKKSFLHTRFFFGTACTRRYGTDIKNEVSLYETGTKTTSGVSYTAFCTRATYEDTPPVVMRTWVPEKKCLRTPVSNTGVPSKKILQTTDLRCIIYLKGTYSYTDEWEGW